MDKGTEDQQTIHDILGFAQRQLSVVQEWQAANATMHQQFLDAQERCQKMMLDLIAHQQQIAAKLVGQQGLSDSEDKQSAPIDASTPVMDRWITGATASSVPSPTAATDITQSAVEESFCTGDAVVAIPEEVASPSLATNMEIELVAGLPPEGLDVEPIEVSLPDSATVDSGQQTVDHEPVSELEGLSSAEAISQAICPAISPTKSPAIASTISPTISPTIEDGSVDGGEELDTVAGNDLTHSGLLARSLQFSEKPLMAETSAACYLARGAKIWLIDDGSDLAREVAEELRDRLFRIRVIPLETVDYLTTPARLDALVIFGLPEGRMLPTTWQQVIRLFRRLGETFSAHQISVLTVTQVDGYFRCGPTQTRTQSRVGLLHRLMRSLVSGKGGMNHIGIDLDPPITVAVPLDTRKTAQSLVRQWLALVGDNSFFGLGPKCQRLVESKDMPSAPEEVVLPGSSDRWYILGTDRAIASPEAEAFNALLENAAVGAQQIRLDDLIVEALSQPPKEALGSDPMLVDAPHAQAYLQSVLSAMAGVPAPADVKMKVVLCWHPENWESPNPDTWSTDAVTAELLLIGVLEGIAQYDWVDQVLLLRCGHPWGQKEKVLDLDPGDDGTAFTVASVREGYPDCEFVDVVSLATPAAAELVAAASPDPETLPTDWTIAVATDEVPACQSYLQTNRADLPVALILYWLTLRSPWRYLADFKLYHSVAFGHETALSVEVSVQGTRAMCRIEGDLVAEVRFDTEACSLPIVSNTLSDPVILPSTDLYGQQLIQDPRLQILAGSSSYAPEGFYGSLLLNATAQCWAGGEELLQGYGDVSAFPPLLFEGAVQLMLVWAQIIGGRKAVPGGFERFEILAEPELSGVQRIAVLGNVRNSSTSRAHFDIAFMAGQEGQPVARLLGARTTFSPKLTINSFPGETLRPGAKAVVVSASQVTGLEE